MKKIKESFLRLFQKGIKWIIVSIILAAVGFVFKDELSIIIKERLFYGIVEVIANDQNLKNHGQIIIINNKLSQKYSFLLKVQSDIRLPSGNFTLQVFYPEIGNSKKLIFETPFELKRREYKKININAELPNTIIVELEIPKKEFVPEEQISFSITSNKDGYLWIFSPDSRGNPNMFFPNEKVIDNNIKAGKKHNVPSDNSFVLKTRSTPGEETIVCIVTQYKDQQFALSRLKKVIPSILLKITVTQEQLWGYDIKKIKVKKKSL